MFRSSLIRPITRSLSSRRLHGSAIRRSTEPIPTPEGSGAVSEMSPKVASIVDSVSQLTLLETSQLVQALKTKFNITEAVQVVAGAGGAPASAAAAPAEEKPVEKSEFKVMLQKIDAAQKAKVIREIKNLMPDMNLVAAKKFVESTPKVIKDAAPKDVAEKIKKTLEALGATVALE
ncbi:54S ribosomal protein L12, mitochondrial [Coemansia sp. RSA 989]|nr:ribosomal protein L7/L12 C-terminal domain-containing protein [Coemansia mojavensis]KAJ1742107.1 54S ribosomal protein L12, mitochondrial [Coemansia sp. RSA 1086]KAJ1750633.1 54S ribosomal protein L12, mitochondrial [Coemansia sp. RSA 1821]KAJ1865251.1 54S ribosomal protein L12, mitochondrial [Coemansia sp. RSA 989]KAJ1872631.1 54S ribosomal protein L12, mitochondrial [Coemansia sp. RSA 990]KAJ2631547.1 54S ribosomal protein L12, mitochondrial [Coemansia sp. RSA 1290]KAJ2647552.1 54S ribos